MTNETNKHSKRYWNNRNFPDHEQFIKGLKEAGLYKKPDKEALKRLEEAKQLIKEVNEERKK
ncbi:hypothetical protein [Lactobacillus corticis]|uniref:Uncharacterized protein n=1 Tax=Lactobacillus corticis TaxID=2201249 RepID=A0A916QJ80_9LACO|nr:hypothetical protein [Lactobacillus corticis]GFZ27247.1 hypothetical protein LCB40_11270 [Lactobacillus corticis]